MAEPHSPIQALPFDILSEIFFRTAQPPHALHDDPSASTNKKAKSQTIGGRNVVHPDRTPLLLCHICRSWRNTALSIPALWDGVYLPITYIQVPPSLRIDPDNAEAVEGKLSLWTDTLNRTTVQLAEWWEENLGRSSPAPALWAPSILVRKGGQVAELLNSIFKYSPYPSLAQFLASSFFHSAKRIEFDALNKDILKVLCYGHIESHQGRENPSPLPLSFPKLVELRIQNFNYWRGHGHQEFDHTFPHAPSLLRIFISHQSTNTFFDEALNKPFFHFSRLTHLSLASPISHGSWKVLLKTCINLFSFAVSLSMRYDDPGTDQQNRIVIPGLSHLAVSCKQLYDPTPFYEFSFPALISLRIISTDLNRFKSLGSIELFLCATPNLKVLHFDFCLSFENFLFIPFDALPPSYKDRRLSNLIPDLEGLVLNYIDPGDMNVPQNITKFLYSNWLCSGWHQSDSRQRSRSLELHIMSDSYFTSKRCSEIIIPEVERMTQERHPVFDMISVHRAKPGEERFKVFDSDNLISMPLV